ncbi:MAG: glycosyltransferase, partial [Solirubrobacteraceae bacterium]
APSSMTIPGITMWLPGPDPDGLRLEAEGCYMQGSSWNAQIDGTTGLLAPPGEPAAWSEAIRRILEHPDWAREMGRRAGELAHRRFAIERHVAAMMEVYRSVDPARGSV